MGDDRRDDWSHGVDENLASLNAGQRVWERDIASIRKALADMDKILRGDFQNDTDGMIPRLHQQENDMNMLKAVVLKDKAGNKGIQGDVEDLKRGERRSENRLKIWVAIVGLLSMVMTASVSNIDRIQAFFSHARPALGETPIPKKSKRHKHVHVEEPEPDEQ